MNRIILLLAVTFLFLSIYFFAKKDIFWGSVTLLICVVFNLLFAMLANTNKPENKN